MKSHSFSVWAGLFMTMLVACKSETPGEIVLGIKTDMSMPKDLAYIHIEGDKEKNEEMWLDLKHEFEIDGGARIPATLALLMPARERLVRITVSGYADDAIKNYGKPDQEVIKLPRVKKDVITTVPVGKVVYLPVSLDYLCDDPGSTKPMCVKEGETCGAGMCLKSDVDSGSSPRYDPADIYGGGTGNGDGTCFDTANCFDDAQNVSVSMETGADCIEGHCRCIGVPEGDFDPTVGINVALKTQGAGMCKNTDCFVALNNGSEAGWKLFAKDNQRIEFPLAVCTKVNEGKIVGIVWKKAEIAPCQQKVESIPTCGPWSASGVKYAKPTDRTQPVLVAVGQTNPESLALTTEAVYWTNRGKINVDQMSEGQGTVKRARKVNGSPIDIASGQYAPTGISVIPSPQVDFVLWTNELSLNSKDTGSLRWAKFDRISSYPSSDTLVGLELLQNRFRPYGIGVIDWQTHFDVFYTEIGTSEVSLFTVDVDQSLGTLSIPPAEKPTLVTGLGVFPYGIAAVKGFEMTANSVCWTFNGTTSMAADGIVACRFKNASAFTISLSEVKPRNIVVHERVDGTYIMWEASGSKNRVRTAKWANLTLFGPYDLIDSSCNTGVGFAVDSADTANEQLYVSGCDQGKIVRVAFEDVKTAFASSPNLSLPLSLDKIHNVISERPNLGALAVDEGFVYWIEKGSPGTPTGAILKLDKANIK